MSARDAELIQAVRGPLTIITIGTLFAIDRLTPVGIGQTWPVLLIVVGVLQIAVRTAVSRVDESGGPK